MQHHVTVGTTSDAARHHLSPGPWPTGCPPVAVAVSVLRPSDSPRLDGENSDHVRLLAESRAAGPPAHAASTHGAGLSGGSRTGGAPPGAGPPRSPPSRGPPCAPCAPAAPGGRPPCRGNHASPPPRGG